VRCADQQVVSEKGRFFEVGAAVAGGVDAPQAGETEEKTTAGQKKAAVLQTAAFAYPVNGKV